MPIDSVHPKYKLRLPQWQKCRDAFEGEDAIKERGSEYLPKLKGQSEDDYSTYKRRALFYSITAKSVSALVGMATSCESKKIYPDSMKQYFEDSLMIQFDEIFSVSLTETLLQSRCGILVDLPSDGGDPYPTIYSAEDIINWRTNESGEPTMVMLREVYDNEIDEYQTESAIRYRELRLDDLGEYVQIIHESKRVSTLTSQSTQTSIPPESFDSVITKPTVSGVPMTEIPFYLVNPLGIGFADHKPLMLDIANINISHYMSSADLEHGRHFTGLPTPVIIGADSNKDLFIGSTKFLVIPDKGGNAKYLEFTGQGLQSLEKAMAEKQGQLASLSARLLDQSSRGSEAADAVKLRYSSETASLTTVVKSIRMALNLVYKTIAVMLKEDPSECSIVLGTDFMEAQLSAAEMNALFEGYIAGAISKESLVYNLRRGQRLDPNRSDDDEMKSIKEPLPQPAPNQTKIVNQE